MFMSLFCPKKEKKKRAGSMSAERKSLNYREIPGYLPCAYFS